MINQKPRLIPHPGAPDRLKWSCGIYRCGWLDGAIRFGETPAAAYALWFEWWCGKRYGVPASVFRDAAYARGLVGLSATDRAT